MAEEIELKLALPPAARRALLRHPLLATAEKLGTRRLSNVYFDTPDLDLHRHTVALRTRKQGRRWLQTVKCAGAVSAGLTFRPEWEQPYAGRFDFTAVDDARVRKLLERHHVHLAPAFETTFSRRTWRLNSALGASVLVMLDQGRIEAGGATDAISELELELEHGDAGALFDLAQRLAADLPLHPALLSKAERGYRLRAQARLRPVRAGPSPLRPGQSPADAFRALAAACLEQLQWNALGIGEDDPEFIHQMRVALRRLRSALRVFRPVLAPETFETAVPPIRALARRLGAARDTDVLAQDIVAPAAAAFPTDPRLAALSTAVAARRAAAHAEAREALEAPAHAHFLLSLGAQLHRPVPETEEEPIDAFAARRLTRLHKKAVALAEAAADLDPGRLHRLRIGAKRLRYALEFFAPLYRPKEVKPALAVLTGLQDALGALNDLASAGAPLLACAGEDATLREAVALVGGWHGPRYERLRAELPGRIAGLSNMKRFWRSSKGSQ